MRRPDLPKEDVCLDDASSRGPRRSHLGCRLNRLDSLSRRRRARSRPNPGDIRRMLSPALGLSHKSDHRWGNIVRFMTGYFAAWPHRGSGEIKPSGVVRRLLVLADVLGFAPLDNSWNSPVPVPAIWPITRWNRLRPIAGSALRRCSSRWECCCRNHTAPGAGGTLRRTGCDRVDLPRGGDLHQTR